MNDAKSEAINLRMTKAQKLAISAAASKQNRTLTNYILTVVLGLIKEQEA